MNIRNGMKSFDIKIMVMTNSKYVQREDGSILIYLKQKSDNNFNASYSF